MKGQVVEREHTCYDARSGECTLCSALPGDTLMRGMTFEETFGKVPRLSCVRGTATRNGHEVPIMELISKG